ncbi:MAG: hypothetical protein ACK5WF_03070 [Cyclobacteriaceae bacterium]
MSPQIELRFQSSMNLEVYAAEKEKGVFQLLQKYIVRATRSGLMIIDQQAAHERVLYEKYLGQVKGVAGNSQQSLFPQTVYFSPPDFALLMEMEKEVIALGFRLEVMGKNALLITGAPAQIQSTEKEVLEGVIEQFKKNQSELQLPIGENLARSMAKRTSVKTGDRLKPEEVEGLVAGLCSCNNPHYSPDGRPTFFTFDSSKLESYFNR